MGRHLGMGIDPGTKMDIEIVGVAGDTKYEDMRDGNPLRVVSPLYATGFCERHDCLHARARRPRRHFQYPRRVVREVDPAVPMYDLRTLDDQIEISLFIQRLLATLSSVFGCLATLLAALGLYGVMAYMVARRTREIGIRMAFGANSGLVVWMVMREVLVLAAVGVAIGLIAAWAATRLLQAQLFGVGRPTCDYGRRRAGHCGRVRVVRLFPCTPCHHHRSRAGLALGVGGLGSYLPDQMRKIHRIARFGGARQPRSNGQRLVMIFEPHQEGRALRSRQALLIQPRIVGAHVGIYQ